MIRKDSTPCSYEQFHSRLKSKFKKEKQQRKQNLRQIACRKLVESSDGSNDEQYLKRTGNRWWGRISRHYFPHITPDLLDNMRQWSTSEDVMGFGSPASSLLHFYREVLCGHASCMRVFFDDCVRVVYRLWDKLEMKEVYVLAGYLCRNGQQDMPGQSPLLPINFYSFHNPKISPPRPRTPSQLQQLLQESKDISIELSGFTDDNELIQKCLFYENVWRDQGTTEIEKEIECWKYQLECQHKVNQLAWDRIEAAWEKEKEIYPEFKGIEQRIDQLKKQLTHCETFSYFRLGYSDKTGQDFSSAVTYIKQGSSVVQSKYLKKSPPRNDEFETDCKICFCIKNQIGNKVIYCDSCNTSFHQSCYGIENLDYDKEFICDTCVYRKRREHQRKGYEPLSCQICGRSKFPIKCINDHYYHVSCLILFDFADIHEFKITLKKGITHESIMQAVLENQMEQDNCEFCLKWCFTGMKFKCSYPLCTKSFHPICAYLNGCLFDISRKKEGGINVKVQCRDHFVSEFGEIALQVYLRRYLCNYRHTATMKEEVFRDAYKRDLEILAKSNRGKQFQEGGIKRVMKFKRLKPTHNDSHKKRSDSLRKSQSLIEDASNQKSIREPPKVAKVESTKQKPSQSLI